MVLRVPRIRRYGRRTIRTHLHANVPASRQRRRGLNEEPNGTSDRCGTMVAPDDPPLWPTAEVVEHFVEHFRWDSEPHAAYEGSSTPRRLDLRQPCETGIIGASSQS